MPFFPMRGPALVAFASIAIAGCIAEEGSNPVLMGIRILGDVDRTTLVESSSTFSHSDGVERSSMPFALYFDNETTPTIVEGGAAHLAITTGRASYRISNWGDQFRTIVRWEDACTVTQTNVWRNGTIEERPFLFDGHLTPEWPYDDYRFSGACEARVFALWSPTS